MSESTPETKPQTKKQRKNILCYVHEKAQNYDLVRVNKFVCRDLETKKYTDGNHYCILHLPTIQKNINEFNRLIESRIEEVDKKVAKIETNFPNDEEKQNNAKNKWELFYDFSYVCFPEPISFFDKTFKDLVFFSSATFCGYADFRSAKFEKDAHFNDVTFLYSALFMSAKFLGNTIFANSTFYRLSNFEDTIFNDVTFTFAKFSLNSKDSKEIFDCLFCDATFNKSAIFNAAEFYSIANFGRTTFHQETSFPHTTFYFNADFQFARFEETSQTYFQSTRFLGYTSFNQTYFLGYVIFQGEKNESVFVPKKTVLDLQHARIEDVKQLAFHTVFLRPFWFVNVDSRKFVFTDIDWENLDSDYKNKNINRELDALENRGITAPKKRLLEITARQLAVNAEENNRYEEATKFRYMAMETKRLQNKGWKQYVNLYWLYKQSSEYGENWIRAIYWLALIWVYFALVYWLIGEFQDNKTISFLESFGYSLQVMLLQKPEPKPFGWFTVLYYGLETILSPLQAALLALAIRRKFMR